MSKVDPADRVPTITVKCPTCGAVPDEDCHEGRAGNMRLVPLHPFRTAAGNRLKALNEKMTGAIFGKPRKRTP